MAGSTHSTAPTLLCFGEILWDFLPRGLFPGGAPFNVAYHLHQHGTAVSVVSAVGRDVLGGEILRRIRAWHLATGGITEHPNLQTGYVQPVISATGDATYAFAPNVAWDRIELTPAIRQQAARAQGLIYGSLAQRSAFNRAALDELFAALPPDAWRIFDVNLRPPHDNEPALIRALAAHATLLKLNADEAARLAAHASESPGREETDARTLAAQTGCATVCITAGERGAGLLRDGQWLWESAQPVTVVDTVGAGDAFLASLVTHLMAGQLSPAASLARACRLGEWVATQPGATPDYANALL